MREPEIMNRKVRLLAGLGLMCAAAAAMHPARASTSPALSARSSQDFTRLDLDGDGKLSRDERRSAPALLLNLDLPPSPADAVPLPLLYPAAPAVEDGQPAPSTSGGTTS
jgi:hypothetical protein